MAHRQNPPVLNDRTGEKATPKVLSATSIIGDHIKNLEGQDLGKIEELMIDLQSGRVAYAVLSFGGFLGLGDKLFAVPWNVLTLNADEKTFYMDADKELMEKAPGFDKDHWPQTEEREWLDDVYRYYGKESFWGSDDV